jgi:hypothetical protein
MWMRENTREGSICAESARLPAGLMAGPSLWIHPGARHGRCSRLHTIPTRSPVVLHASFAGIGENCDIAPLDVFPWVAMRRQLWREKAADPDGGKRLLWPAGSACRSLITMTGHTGQMCEETARARMHKSVSTCLKNTPAVPVLSSLCTSFSCSVQGVPPEERRCGFTHRPGVAEGPSYASAPHEARSLHEPLPAGSTILQSRSTQMAPRVCAHWLFAPDHLPSTIERNAEKFLPGARHTSGAS